MILDFDGNGVHGSPSPSKQNIYKSIKPMIYDTPTLRQLNKSHGLLVFVPSKVWTGVAIDQSDYCRQ